MQKIYLFVRNFRQFGAAAATNQCGYRKLVIGANYQENLPKSIRCCWYKGAHQFTIRFDHAMSDGWQLNFYSSNLLLLLHLMIS